jgi:hypothetical protein
VLFIGGNGIISSASVCQTPPSRLSVVESSKVDQVGYLPTASKVAMVVAKTATGTFAVHRLDDGEPVFRGTLSAPTADAGSGDRVQAAANGIDDQESYASNEIAINWNAPLVFLLADQLPKK